MLNFLNAIFQTLKPAPKNFIPRGEGFSKFTPHPIRVKNKISNLQCFKVFEIVEKSFENGYNNIYFTIWFDITALVWVTSVLFCRDKNVIFDIRLVFGVCKALLHDEFRQVDSNIAEIRILEDFFIMMRKQNQIIGYEIVKKSMMSR